MPSEIKPVCGLERIKLSDVVPLDAPFTAFVFPTTFCNFRCKYCGHSLGPAKMKEQYGFKAEHMPMETYRKVIEQLKEFPSKLKLLSLTGHGEPLLNKYLPEMIRLAKEAEIAERIEIISNASLLNEKISMELIDAGLDTLRISMQGLSSEKYSSVCGVKLDFDKLISQIRFFYEHKQQCSVFVKIMDIALDQGEEDRFYEIFRDISDRMYIEQCRPVYYGVDYQNENKLIADRYGRVHEKRHVCPLSFFMIGIFPDGDVEPCDTIYKPVVIGNVNQEPLIKIWNGKKHHDFQIQQLEGRRYENKACSTCCAPDDVSHPEDELDGAVSEIMKKISARRF